MSNGVQLNRNKYIAISITVASGAVISVIIMHCSARKSTIIEANGAHERHLDLQFIWPIEISICENHM
jgi:hypothetical protein